MTVYEAISLMLAFGLIIIAILFSKKKEIDRHDKGSGLFKLTEPTALKSGYCLLRVEAQLGSLSIF